MHAYATQLEQLAAPADVLVAAAQVLREKNSLWDPPVFSCPGDVSVIGGACDHIEWKFKPRSMGKACSKSDLTCHDLGTLQGTAIYVHKTQQGVQALMKCLA